MPVPRSFQRKLQELEEFPLADDRRLEYLKKVRVAASLAAVPLILLGGCGEQTSFIATGGFMEQLLDTRVQHVQGMRVADLDGDGVDEIIAALSLTDAIHVYQSTNEDRTAWKATNITAGRSLVATDVDLADIDGDGDLDIASVGLFQRDAGPESAGDIIWYENPGDLDSPWTEHAVLRANRDEFGDYAGMYGPLRIRIADLDGDADLDFVVGAIITQNPQAQVAGGGVHWFENVGSATAPNFRGPFPIDTQGSADDLQVVDLDADGTLDVVISGETGRRLTWYRQTANGFARQDLIANTPVYNFDTVQLDTDPELEIFATLIETASISVHRVNLIPGTTTATSIAIVSSVPNPQGSQPRMVVSDFTGGDVPDIILGSTGNGNISRYSRDNDGGWNPREIRRGYIGINSLLGADIDRDGKQDLVTGTYEFGTRDRIAWWRNVD